MEWKRWFQIGRRSRQARGQEPPRRGASEPDSRRHDTGSEHAAEAAIHHSDDGGSPAGPAGDALNSEPAASDPRRPPTDGPPAAVSHYRILRKLGEGGMGVVYEAEDTKLGRLVALKFLHADAVGDALALERFRIEARAVSAVNHPNICTVHEIDECEGRTFIAMELLEGQTLRQHLRGKGLRAERLLNLAIQLADGLDAAHAKRVVHRDIKPENLFVLPQDRVKILDFGLAKFHAQPRHTAADGAASDLTTQPALDRLSIPGIRMGTPAYMSPEQVRGEELDPRTDLFSFGAVLFEMASGKRAFAGRSAADISAAVLGETPVLPFTVDPQIRAGLQAICEKALEKTREFRYQHASDIAADLRRLKRGLEAGVALPAAASLAAPPPAPASLRRLVAADVLKAVAFCLLVVGVHDFLDRRPSGRHLGQFQTAFVQENLRRQPIDEADFETGGRSLPLIVNISHLHPDKKRPTDRKLLDLLIDELRRHGARAIGVDLSFDDLEGPDFQYLEKWTAHQNVRVGIYRRAVEKREAWLGRPEFSGLAAGIALPADNPQHAFFYSRRWFLRTALTGPDIAEPRDCTDPGPVVNCKEDLIQLPVAMWLLSERQRLASEEAVRNDELEVRLKRALHALQVRSSERALANAMEFGEYSIDYSYLKAAQDDIFTLIPSPPDGTLESAIASLGAQESRIADRVVLVGDLDDTTDQFCQSPGSKPLPGVLIHACSLATLNRGMLFEITGTPTRTVALGVALFLAGAVVGLRVFHTRSRFLREWPFQYVEILAFGAMAIVAFLAFTWEVRVAGVVWPHFLWLSGGLFVHPFFSEPCYRAVVATPQMLHAAARTLAGRTSGS